MNLSLNANSVGERVVVGLAILAMCWEVIHDNGCGEVVAEPIDVETCEAMCWGQDLAVKRWESYACECAAGGD